MCSQLITFRITLILQFVFKLVVSDCPSQGCVNCSTVVWSSGRKSNGKFLTTTECAYAYFKLCWAIVVV